MRIVLASDLYAPVVGGVTSFTRNLARKLAEQGNQVLVIAPSRTRRKLLTKENDYRLVGVPSFPLPIFNRFRLAVNPYGQVKQIIADFKPNVVHIQTPLGIGWSALRAGKKYHIPIVSTNHAMPENLIENLKLLAPFARPISVILKQYGYLFHERVDYVTLPTQSAIEMLRRATFKVPVTAISNGIDLKRFSPGATNPQLRRRFGFAANDRLLLYVGRLDSEKRVGVLLEAMAYLSQHQDIKLLIVGTGNDEANLKLLTAQLHIEDKVVFAGFVDDKQLPLFYRLADLFVMASPVELQSIATLEAMASGLPVVAVKAGALPELCQEGKNGRLVKVGDPKDMAAKLLDMLKDSQRLKSFGQASLAIAKQHDLAVVAKRYVALYKKVQTSGSRSRKRRRALAS